MAEKLKKNSYHERSDSILKGQAIIKSISKTLPQQPGVYQMEDENSNILYLSLIHISEPTRRP